MEDLFANLFENVQTAQSAHLAEQPATIYQYLIVSLEMTQMLESGECASGAWKHTSIQVSPGGGAGPQVQEPQRGNDWTRGL